MKQLDYKVYLENKLNNFLDLKLITGYKLSNKSDKYSRIDVNARDFQLRIYTDFQKTMEVVIDDYYREVTDYLSGDYKDTIDWYLEIVKNLAEKKYAVTQYSRHGKIFCKYLSMNVRDNQISIGDFRNHFKLFSKKSRSVGSKI